MNSGTLRSSCSDATSGYVYSGHRTDRTNRTNHEQVGRMVEHTDPSDVTTSLMRPLNPHVVVLFGATGDLSRRKLLPGMLHLFQAGLLPECRIIGTSLDDLDDDSFRTLARKACD